MRIRWWLLLFLLLVIAGAWLGAMMQLDPGYILLAWRETTVEMSLWVGLVLILIAFVSLYLVLRVLFSVQAPWQFLLRWSAEGKLRRMQRQTRHGLLALANGQYGRAVEKLAGLVANTSQPLVVIPALAEAEARLGQFDQAQARLQQLLTSMPEAAALVGLTQARIFIQQGDAEAALQPLQQITAKDKRHGQANEMLLELLQGLHRWTDVIALLQAIDSAKQMPAEVLAQQQQKAYSQAFAHLKPGSDGVEQLLQLWRKAPSAVQQSSGCRLALVQAMGQAEGKPAQSTAEFIESSLQQQWDDALVLEYAHLPMTNVEQALRQAETWQLQARQSAALQLTLGRLCRRLELWGKARDYLRASIQLQASKEAHAELARLEQQLGQLDVALEHYRLASVF
ncbi:MAG: heme biosynthesis HemY N-terminal domain-containing protein [Gammaproteobacteria bacterium]|jgi:HemY protein|nr:heme biosynthesis HemY N-terminal domain-containing protein [Gammaproteobacteria bacterium]